MAGRIEQPSELWELERYLTQRRKDIDCLYDYRYSMLPVVFGITSIAKHKVLRWTVLEILLTQTECVENFLRVVELCSVGRVHCLALENANQTVL